MFYNPEFTPVLQFSTNLATPPQLQIDTSSTRDRSHSRLAEMRFTPRSYFSAGKSGPMLRPSQFGSCQAASGAAITAHQREHQPGLAFSCRARNVVWISPCRPSKTSHAARASDFGITWSQSSRWLPSSRNSKSSMRLVSCRSKAGLHPADRSGRNDPVNMRSAKYSARTLRVSRTAVGGKGTTLRSRWRTRPACLRRRRAPLWTSAEP